MLMTDTIALVVDPDFGVRIREVVRGVLHTWVVASPANVAVAEEIWRGLPNARENNMEGGVTTFVQSGADRESWCDAILHTLDEHHNSHSREPGYAILQVYGIPFAERLRTVFVECGFSIFTPTDYGFCAQKLQPT